MSLGEIVLLGAIQGLAEALPLSGPAHEEIARIWLEPAAGGGALEGVFELAAAAAMAFAARRRLAAALGEGVRAIARPVLFRASPGAHDAGLLVLAATSALITRALLGHAVGGIERAPLALGAGLLLTASALASTAFAPRGKLDAPSFTAALPLGAAVGLAVLPGVSAIATALAALLWIGVKPARAVNLALLLALPALAITATQLLLGPERLSASGLDTGAIVAGALVAFLSASLAVSALRRILERRRLSMLALWLVPLGLATIAYARALPEGIAEVGVTRLETGRPSLRRTVKSLYSDSRWSPCACSECPRTSSPSVISRPRRRTG